MSLLSEVIKTMPVEIPQDGRPDHMVIWEEYYEACACAERAMRQEGADF